MKIKKLNESVLKEEEKLSDGEIKASTDAADADASIVDIARDLQAQAADGEGGSVISDAAAVDMAAEAKDVAQAIDADEVVADTPAIAEEEEDLDANLKIDNALTRRLDELLRKALVNRRRHKSTNVSNLVVVGLPGSGKTASFMDWAKNNPVNYTYVNAKNNDLDAFMNGYTVRVAGEGEDRVGGVSQAYSNNLDSLDKPNSILFLDELNRQTKDQIRASLLTLINEHRISGKGKNGYRYFPNLLFTVACCNPHAESDKGAGNLNNAEMTRFGEVFRYDSNPKETQEYLTKSYMKAINHLDKEDEYYKEDLYDYLKTLDLGLALVTDSRFFYDGLDDLDSVYLLQQDYNVSGGADGQLWNQRLLTIGLDKADGDKDKFLDWVDNGIIILEKDRDMIHGILDQYQTPTFEELCQTYHIDQPAPEVEPEVADAAAEEPVVDHDDEEDAELFTTNVSGNAGGSVTSGQAAADKIKAAIANFPR